VEALNDEYPSSFVLSHCIWPYESGEVIVQNYNVLLSLSHLQDFADGIILVQNEQLSSMCRVLLGIPRPSFDHMNEVAVQALASVLLPSQWKRSTEPNSQLGVDNRRNGAQNGVTKENSISRTYNARILAELLLALCAHPGYKMLTSRFTPQVGDSQFTTTCCLVSMLFSQSDYHLF
jgi:tubulin delta